MSRTTRWIVTPPGIVTMVVGCQSALGYGNAPGWNDWVDTGFAVSGNPFATDATPPNQQPATFGSVYLTQPNKGGLFRLTVGASTPILIGQANQKVGAPTCVGDPNSAFCVSGSLNVAELGKYLLPRPTPIPCKGISCIAREAAPQLVPLQAWHLNWIDQGKTDPKWRRVGHDASALFTLVGRQWSSLQLIAVGAPNRELVTSKFQTDGTWLSWENHGGPLYSAPGCYGSVGEAQDCYAKSAGGRMIHIAYTGTQWLAPELLQYELDSRPSIISWKPGVQELFYRAGNGELVHITGAGSSWGEPEYLGGSAASDYTCTALGTEGMVCYARFDDGHLWKRTWVRDRCAIAQFYADPAVITSGSSTTLRWSTPDCPVSGNHMVISNSADQQSSSIDVSGQTAYTVNPQGSLTYFLTAGGPWVQDTASVNVTVNPKNITAPEWMVDSAQAILNQGPTGPGANQAIPFAAIFPDPLLTPTGRPVSEWEVQSIKNDNSFQIFLLAYGKDSDDCFANDSGKFISSQGTISGGDLKDLYGANTPRPPLALEACVLSGTIIPPRVSLYITYRH